MESVYLDIHIHTSSNPNELNQEYDVTKLLERINEVSNNSTHLISLTDHNTINEPAYLNLLKLTQNVILGCELHIKNYEERKPYHCHILFDISEITSESIKPINEKLDKLYPNKEINKDTPNVPSIETIIRTFDEYDFLLLPHGGQSHSTFDESVARDVKFDSTIERTIYYNQFDGFTARGNTGLDNTQEYFRKLGILDFVNLVTCSDNYNPYKYPSAKSDDAEPFIPTWMHSLPTFQGLRLSLSESSRLEYSFTKPEQWSEYIGKVYLENEHLDINIELTPGLNVVIGGSSSGKTLLVDSIYRKITENFEESDYTELGVENISVSHPSGTLPHYISQNYIIKIIDLQGERSGIENIDIIKKVFPEDNDVVVRVRSALNVLKQDVCDLIDCVQSIEEEIKNINRIPLLTRLVTERKTTKNPLSNMLPTDDLISSMEFSEPLYENYVETLEEIRSFMRRNPLAENVDDEIDALMSKLTSSFDKSQFEIDVRKAITSSKDSIDTELASSFREQHTKLQQFELLISSIASYTRSMSKFNKTLDKISKYSMNVKSRKVESLGHKLFITNNFELTKEKVIEALNRFLKSGSKISSFDEIEPHKLFLKNFKQQSPKVYSYEDLQLKIYTVFEKMNTRNYKIITREGKEFENLSAGWKTSVLLDLILGYEGDLAPLIIDQPEDNLATNYINTGLINSIKRIKSKKQVILVSHNATIPMLGDAQNVVLCQNEGSIVIRSSRLEGEFDDKTTLDYIAQITDGGKSSIKKRVKKYNLKKFRGENE